MDISRKSIHIFLLWSLNSLVLWFWFCQSGNIQPLSKLFIFSIFNWFLIPFSILDKEVWNFGLQSLKFHQILVLKPKLVFHPMENVSCTAVVLLLPGIRNNLRKSLSLFYFLVMQLSKGVILQHSLRFCVILQKKLPNISIRPIMKSNSATDTALPVDLCLCLRLKS